LGVQRMPAELTFVVVGMAVEGRNDASQTEGHDPGAKGTS
jgi:hypothetical protein